MTDGDLDIKLAQDDENQAPIILALFEKLVCKNILRIHYQGWNDFLSILVSHKNRDNVKYKLDNLHQIKKDFDMNSIKIVFMIAYGDMKILNIVSNLFSDKKILFFTLDYPKVYGRNVCRVWQDIRMKLNPNIYYVETGIKSIVKKYTDYIFDKTFTKDRIFTLPYFPNKHFVREDINTKCNSKILLTGALSVLVYKERVEMAKLFEKYDDCEVQRVKYKQDVYRDYMRGFLGVYAGPVDFSAKWRHKGYQDMNHKFITTKYFEITSLGCLLLADDSSIDMLKAYGFIDMVTCIYINKHNHRKKLDFVLNPDNRDIIDEIRSNGQKMVNTKYTQDNVFNMLCDVFRELS